MKLPEFDYVEPETIQEACALLHDDPEGSVAFAGGTDVLVNLREKLVTCRRLVSLRRIAALARVTYSPDSGACLGTTATVNQVAGDEAIWFNYPGIVDAALSLADDQVRNTATVGGNLCSAVPSADMAPILLAHGAHLRVASPDGERRVALTEFFQGPRQTILAAGEVVTAIEVPPPAPGQGDASLRQGGRACLSLPLASAAAVVRMADEVCASATLALGAVAPTPIVATAVGDLLAGQRLDDELLARAGELAREASHPIDDHRASRAYRLELIEVLTRRVLSRAAERASGRAS